MALALRSVREAARSRSTIWLRAGLLVLLILAVIAGQQVARHSSLGGMTLFAWVAWCDFILLTLMSISSFSTVLTEEKERMTLGLLRMAGFTPLSLLLGKSVGLLLNLLLLLVVQVPFCLLAITLGGVTTHQVLGVFGLLSAYVLFLYSLALLCSVIRQRNTGAAVMTAILLVAYHLLPLVLGLLSGVMRGNARGPLHRVLLGWVDTMAITTLFRSTSMRGSFGATFGPSITTHLTMAAALFTLAWLLFERCNRDERPAAPARADALAIFRRGRRRSATCGRNPFLWKDYRFLSGGTFGVISRLFAYVALLVAIRLLVPVQNMAQEQFGGLVMGIGMLSLVVELGMQAGRVFGQEVKERTLASLLITPGTLRHIAWSKVLGSAATAIPGLLVFACGAALAPSNAAKALRESLTEPRLLVSAITVLFGLHLAVYYSLRVRFGAAALAFGSVIVGWMLLGVLFQLMGHSGADGMMILTSVLLVAGCAALQMLIARAMRTAAAEES
ncbi:MAG: hypothetical protein KDC87_06380 [Planctomycetes bacterium]|nr:hypothetical protein [Planctomycetota bacterium]